MLQMEQQRTRAITSLSATELAEKVRAGELSAVEVIEAHIQRIEEVNGVLNAVVIPLFDQARAAAAEADAKRARGEPLGRLHGVPVTIKEQYRIAGTQVTLGALNKIGNVYHDEGPLVSKLREEGAIILGKTNIIQTLSNFESDNRVYGRSNNPWNLKRTPGGSSGGEGAIIAAGGSPLGLAGDYGGSTRIPAHFCGVQGFKPTSWRLSNADFPPDLLTGGQETVIPQPGPIARTVADLQLAMAIFAETSLETTFDMVPPVPWPDPAKVDVSTLHIGYYTDNGYFPASPALRRAVEEAAEALRAMGAIVAPFTPPDAAEAIRIFLGSASAGGGADFKQLLGDEKPIPQMQNMFRSMSTPALVMRFLPKIMGARGQNYVAHMIECMGARSTQAYWEIVEARTAYRAQFVRSLEEGGFDAILCPPCALPAIIHGTSGDLFPAMSYGLPYNVIGAPAGVVAATRVRPGEESDRPVGRDLVEITAQQVEQDSAGLPVGVQVVARHWREDIALAVMAALEAHFRTRPDYPTLI
ncbi:MAG: amidase [Chloroflexi bacterium]|nr:amidase [Chloroflexota bacterium]